MSRTKRNRPEHDTPPKDQRNKRDKKGLEGDSLPSNCPVCCNVIVDHDEEKGIEGDDAMFCEGTCNAWIHRTCVGLSCMSYEELSEQESPYFCPQCTSSNQSKEIEELRKLVNSLTSELNSVKLQMLQLKDQHTVNQPNTTQTESQSSSETATANPSPGPPPTQSPQTFNPDIHSTITTILSEEREKEKRQLNLIVHQLTESTKEDPQSRKSEDIDVSSKLIQKYLGTPVTITNAIRLGSKGAKPRLLKISVSSKREKGMILKNCVKLRNKSHPADIQRIYITPDLTPKEQQENKALRSQLLELNKSGKHYKIKNGKVVRRDK